MANHDRAIAVIGPGRLGVSLADALLRAGYLVTHLGGHDPEATNAVATKLAGRVRVCSPEEAVSSAEMVFLTVPDDAIAPVADQLRWRPGQWAVHCSGASGLDVLSAAADVGAVAGCFHPLQSFPSREPESARFARISVGIEASGPLSSALEGIAVAFGSRVVRLEGVDRALYHAAAVFASNDVVALMAAAAETWRLAGLPEDSARAALSPLMLGAAQNVAAAELAEALTGPIARGDLATVERHLEALDGVPELRSLYSALARQLLALPLGHSRETVARLAALLEADA